MDETDPGPVGEPEINKSSHKSLIDDTALRARETVEGQGSLHRLLTRESPEDSWGPEAPRRKVAREMAGQGVQLEVGRGPSVFARSVSGVLTGHRWVCLLLHSADVY